MSKIIEHFAKKNLRIATDRLYQTVEEGGLGLPKLDTFLKAQKCSWIKRTHYKCIDNWRAVLKAKSPSGDITQVRLSDIDQISNPILYNIVSAFESLIKSHAMVDGNYRKAYLYENEAFSWGEDNATVSKHLFGIETYEGFTERIRSLRLIDCLSENNIKTKPEFEQIGLYLTEAAYTRLAGCVRKAMNSFKKTDIKSEEKCESLDEFLKSFKKGSKKIRTIMERQSINRTVPNELQTVKTFGRITCTEVPAADILHTVLRVWNTHYLSNEMREFIFKERNNVLGIGARVQHFDADADERCTFCRILYPPTGNRETFIHLFRSCPVTKGYLKHLLRRTSTRLTIPDTDPDPEAEHIVRDPFEYIYWYGTNGNKVEFSTVLFFELFRFVIWKFKTRRKLPRPKEVSDIFLNMLEIMLLLSPKLREKIRNNPLIALVLQALG